MVKTHSILYVLGVLCTFNAWGMGLVEAENDRQLVEFTHKAREVALNAAMGGVAGFLRTVVNQPLVYFKNTLQEVPKGTIDWRNPRVWYRGFWTNIVAMGPITACQTGTNAMLNILMPGQTAKDRFLKAWMAGVWSGITVGTPLSMVVFDQQKNNQSMVQTAQRLVSEAGPRVMMRGGTATAVREGLLSVTYLAGFPLVYDAIKKNSKNSSDFSNAALYFGTGAVMGILAALVTQPVDTVKTVMQKDYAAKKVRTMRDAITMIHAHRGMYGFFSGAVPRALSYGAAVPIMRFVCDMLSFNK